MKPIDGSTATGTRMSDFDYDLPEELIAQTPLHDRSSSRLMFVDRQSQAISHSSFTELGAFLRPGDLLVLNDSRVIPARLLIRRKSGGRGELLLLHRTENAVEWIALSRPTRRLRAGRAVEVIPVDKAAVPATATILEKLDDSTVKVRLDPDVDANLEAYGHVPLPPYIRTELPDPERYQTVYGEASGSAAAPTAGLHFTSELLSGLEQTGIGIARVTLHVGLDTFRPVTEEMAEDHEIHTEWCSVGPTAVKAIQACRSNGGRVIAVGTTAARTLETLARRAGTGDLASFAGPTDIYITPGYEWNLVDGLITNFHLPKSTLILMVSSFGGQDLIKRAYREAIDRRYRFFSLGDATLIL